MKVRALYQSLIAKYKSNWKWYVIIAVIPCAAMLALLAATAVADYLFPTLADFIPADISQLDLPEYVAGAIEYLFELLKCVVFIIPVWIVSVFSAQYITISFADFWLYFKKYFFRCFVLYAFFELLTYLISPLYHKALEINQPAALIIAFVIALFCDLVPWVYMFCFMPVFSKDFSAFQSVKYGCKIFFSNFWENLIISILYFAPINILAYVLDKIEFAHLIGISTLINIFIYTLRVFASIAVYQRIEQNYIK